MRTAVLAPVLAGCFTAPAHPAPPVDVPPPRVLRPLALEAGQWVRYSERDAHGERGQLWLAAVAAGACGTWVRAELTANDDLRTWLLCVRDDGSAGRDQVARALLDDGAVRELDVHAPGAAGAELDALISRIVSPTLAGAFGREDVTVPAGRFAEALVTRTGATTLWLHPAVPFGGAVKIDDGAGRQDVLVGYGNVSDEIPKVYVRDAQILNRRTLFAAAGAAGAGEWASSGPVAGPDGGELVSLVAGLHLTRTLDVIGVRQHLDTDGADVTTVVAGVRWSPFRAATNARLTNELYLQASAGVADISYPSYPDARGAALAASAGWLFGKGGDWGLGVQLDAGALVIGGPLRAAATLGIGLVLQLEMR